LLALVADARVGLEADLQPIAAGGGDERRGAVQRGIAGEGHRLKVDERQARLDGGELLGEFFEAFLRRCRIDEHGRERRCRFVGVSAA
jgi:hypothetical protein